MVDDNTFGHRLTKKEQRKTIAQQFLMDDQAAGVSKRKYETVNDRRRTMGDKTQKLKKFKENAMKARKVAKKAIKKK